ncbi:MAG: YafY family protein [Bacteroidota bacterium]
MNRVDRLMGILMALQSKKFVPAEKLAEKFEISIRTVYRDVKALNEIGVPVGFEPLKGYCIAQGFFLPPLTFTAEEANALILLHTLAIKFADRSITKHSNTALNKIKAVLKPHHLDRAEALSSQINIYVAKTDKEETDHLTTIQHAIADKTVLSIAYTDNNGLGTKREIEPVGLIFYNHAWHMIGWCWLRNGYRDFKVKMITQLTDTRSAFKKEHDFTTEDYIKIF